MQTVFQKSIEELFDISNSELLCLQDQGKPFEKIKMAGKDYLVLFDHKLLHESGTIKSDLFVRGLMFYPIKRVMGNGILTSDGEDHLRDRRIIQQAFSKDMLEEYLKTFFSVIENKVLSWKENEVIDFYKVATEIVLEIVSSSIFNYDIFNSKQLRDIRNAFPDYVFLDDGNESENLGSFIINQRLQIESLSQILQEIIDKSKLHSNDGNVVDLLLRNESPIFSDKEIRDHLANLVNAGYRTTISLFSWCVFMISENNDVLQELQKEADESLWIKENRPPSLQEIHENYGISKKIIKETLRLYPPIWFSVKQAKEDVDLSSTKILKGTNVLVSQYVTHRNSKIFEDPEKWNPYRWTKDFEKGLPKGSYIPFGQGSRQCIGYDFAIAETQMMLLLMAKYFSWKNISNEDSFVIKPNITLRPKSTIPIVLNKRKENEF